MSCSTTVQRVCNRFLWWTWNCRDQRTRCCSGVVDKWWFVFGIGWVTIRVRNSETTETWSELAFGFIVAHEQGFGTVCRSV